MISLNYEESALLVLFSTIAGNFIEKGKWWVVGAAFTMVIALLMAGARAIHSRHDVSPTKVSEQ